ncbi:hypothetical protein [Chondromyces crocatus]|uniref:Uncharacterized protein n=1 Tax=Chondromyces crocatus TaxID=52 RepID=A0A0K1EFP1_CHOCO|nr:hypothetical protein [Chondromyces crocatus]AKT39512.1 uncharacterized protein CMC5_036590 [Chondromyces crocatus]
MSVPGLVLPVLVSALFVLGCNTPNDAPSSGAPSGSAASSPSGSAASPVAKGSTTAEETAVREAFLRYREALIARKGDEAVALVTTKTIAHYDAMRLAALRMPAAEVRARPLMDLMFILSLRARSPKEELLRSTGAPARFCSS